MWLCRGNKVVMDRARKKPKMTIRNWECGIVCRADRLGFTGDNWDILKRCMYVDEAKVVVEPWILEESGAS